jgi:hypothetical protein
MADTINRKIKLTGDSTSAVNAVNAVNKAVADSEQAFSSLQSNANTAFNALEQRAAIAAQNQRDLFRDSFGDLSSATSALAGGAGALGVDGGVAQFVSDISGAAEFIPKLGESIKDIGTRAAQSTGVLGDLAGGFISLAPGLGLAGAGLAAIALPVAAIAAVAAAATLAISAYNDQVERTKKSAEGIATALQSEVERRFEIQELIKTGNAEELQAKYEEALARAAVITSIIDETRALEEEARARGDSTSADTYKEKIESLSTEFVVAGQTVDDYAKAVADPRIANAVTENVIAQEAAALGYEASTEAAKDLAAEEAKLTAERDRAQQSVENLVDQQARLAQSYLDRARETEAARRLQDTRATEDLNRALAEQQIQHQQNILDIAGDGAQKLEDIQTSIAQAQAQADEDTSKANEDYNEQLADIADKYRKSDLKAAQEFADKRAAIEKAYQDKIADAELNTDVSSFIDAQKERADALSDLDKEQKKAEQSRAEQIDEERTRLAENHVERLTQIKTELTKQQEAAAAQIAQTKAQTDFAIQQAEAVFQAQLAKDEELRRIQQARRDEDRRIQDTASEAALAKSLQDIETKKNAEIAALEVILGKLQLAAPSSNILNISTQSGGLAPLPGGLNGFPSLPSPSGNRGVNVTVTGNNFGAVATPDDVNQMGSFIADSVARGIKVARTA